MTAADPGSAAFCANLVRERDFAAYAHSLFVPSEARRAFLALAAFNSEVAHVRNHVSQPLPGEIRLQWWRDLINGGDHGSDGGPVAAELMRALAVYDLPAEALTRLVDAHVFDVYDDPMPDMAALEAHCRDTASALYKLRSRALGEASPQIDLAADHAGIAEGLLQVMQDLPRHAARRQLYLPGDLLNVHGVTAAEIFARSALQLGEVLAHLRREAGRQYKTAIELVAALPGNARPAFLPLALTERTQLSMETSPPFDPPQLSRLRILWTLWRAARSAPFRN